MPIEKDAAAPNDRLSVIQFTVRGLLTFAFSLLLATAFLFYVLLAVALPHPRTNGAHKLTLLLDTSGLATAANAATAAQPPWGELIETDIELDAPRDYIASESNTNLQTTWVFEGQDPTQVRQMLKAFGLTADQIDRALSPSCLTRSGSNTIVQPQDDLVLSLTPQSRAGLYGQLAHWLENPSMVAPIVCPTATISNIFAGCKMEPGAALAFRKLVYARGKIQCFSDQGVMMRQLSAPEQRAAFIQLLLRHKSVLVQLQVRPDTDVEKLLGYWAAPAANVRYKDVRPLLESMKRVPEGTALGLLYFLPPFARQRLDSFAMLDAAGAQPMNLHWGTFNFFNDPPDDRFYDFGYLNHYLSENYYQIATANAYGDLILLLDQHDQLIHSAVQIAGDLVFTKSGNGYLQPWVLMHLKDLLANSAAIPKLHTSVWRNKEN